MMLIQTNTRPKMFRPTNLWILVNFLTKKWSRRAAALMIVIQTITRSKISRPSILRFKLRQFITVTKPNHYVLISSNCDDSGYEESNDDDDELLEEL